MTFLMKRLDFLEKIVLLKSLKKLDFRKIKVYCSLKSVLFLFVIGDFKRALGESSQKSCHKFK